MPHGDEVGEQALGFGLAQTVEIDVEIGAGDQLGPELGRQVFLGVPVDGVNADAVAFSERVGRDASGEREVDRRPLPCSSYSGGLLTP
jgi:hypothetical protein